MKQTETKQPMPKITTSVTTLEPPANPATAPAQAPEAPENKKDEKARVKSKIAALEAENKFLKDENLALEERVRERDRLVARHRDHNAEVQSALSTVTKERDELKRKLDKRERYATKEQEKRIQDAERRVKAMAKAQELASQNKPKAEADALRLAADRLQEIQRLKGIIGEMQVELTKAKSKK